MRGLEGVKEQDAKKAEPKEMQDTSGHSVQKSETERVQAYDGLMEKTKMADHTDPQAQGNVVEIFKAKTNKLFHEISEMNPAEIVEVAVVGSQCRGLGREGSDLDVVVELSTNEREDVLVDTFNGDGLHIGEVKVDINPVTEQGMGNLETYLLQVEDYLEGVREAGEKGSLWRNCRKWR